jgi:hypothetical protein
MLLKYSQYMCRDGFPSFLGLFLWRGNFRKRRKNLSPVSAATRKVHSIGAARTVITREESPLTQKAHAQFDFRGNPAFKISLEIGQLSCL